MTARHSSLCDRDCITAVLVCSNTAGKLHHFKKTLAALEAHRCIKLIIVYDKTIAAEIPQEFHELINQYEDLNVQLIQGFYGSPGLTRNAAMRFLETKFTVFWDYDDEPVVDVLCWAASQINDSTDVLIFDYLERNEIDGQISSKIKASLIPKELAKRPGIWRMIFRTTKILDTKFRDLSMAEDQIFLDEIGLMNLEITTVGSVGYVYSRNFPGSLTTTKGRIDDLIITAGILESRLDNTNSKSEKLRVGFLARQLISLLKYGSPRSKIFSITHVLLFLHTNKKGIRKLISSLR